MGNKHMKRYSISLTIGEMQINTTVRYHLTPIRITIIKNSTINKCWTGCGEKETLLLCWWECKLIHPSWKTVWTFLKKLGIKLPFCCLAARSCLTLCNSVDSSKPGLPVLMTQKSHYWSYKLWKQ